MTKGIVVQFRRGRKTIKERHYLLDLDLKDRAEAMKMVGKEVVWTSPGKHEKKIKGEIKSAHGNNGLVRAIFERGLPGQAITMDVEVLESGKEKSEESKKDIKEKKEKK